jgi:hypothetical protein
MKHILEGRKKEERGRRKTIAFSPLLLCSSSVFS